MGWARWPGSRSNAGVASKAHERKKRQRLCRYIARPAVCEQRLSLTANGVAQPLRDQFSINQQVT